MRKIAQEKTRLAAGPVIRLEMAELRSDVKTEVSEIRTEMAGSCSDVKSRAISGSHVYILATRPQGSEFSVH